MERNALSTAPSRLRREVLPGRQDLLVNELKRDGEKCVVDDAVATTSRSPARQAGPTRRSDPHIRRADLFVQGPAQDEKIAYAYR
jgi:hypothetical protein